MQVTFVNMLKKMCDLSVVDLYEMSYSLLALNNDGKQTEGSHEISMKKYCI